MKRILYIFIFLTALHFNGFAQSDASRTSLNAVKVVKYYPNPATSYINFEVDADSYKSSTLVIYNFIGKKQMEQKIVERKTTISLTDFYRGMYIFQLYDKQGKIIESGKFTVSK